MRPGRRPRIGLLWRGDRRHEPPSPRAQQRLAPLVAAFAELPVIIEPVVFADEDIDAVRDQLLALDGVMVWVNPIQDGRTREHLDALLREAAAAGVWVSAHPDAVLKLGTKEVLYSARGLRWGSAVELYRSAEDFAARFPHRLAAHGPLVVKQGRGNGGNGVWGVELVEPNVGDAAAALVEVRDARATDGASEQMILKDFLTMCTECFTWSRCLIDQPFQPRLAEGMLRCYFTQDQVVGFCRQWPTRGLLGPDDARAAAAAARASVMEPADAPAYHTVRRQAETEWLPDLLRVLDLHRDSLPVIWDADLLHSPTAATNGQDSFVLCEINTSAVWPFPPTAADAIAVAALAQVSQ